MTGESAHKERATDLGVVRIHNDVIASIAAIAASEIKGVHRLGGGLARNLYGFFANKCSVKGVRIVSREGDVKLSVSVIVEYGVNIPRVSDEVQENIKLQVEKMSGLVLSEVNVDVEGVKPPAPAKGGV